MNQPLFILLAACILAALASSAVAAPRAPVLGEARVASWSPRPAGLLAKRESGDATFYDAGLGACGATNTDNDPIVALAGGLFGNKPGSSPFCGKCLAVTAAGKTLVLKVTDKCPGCSGGSLDMTRAFFQKFYPLDKGRGPISWVEAASCECLGDSPDCKEIGAGAKKTSYPALTDSSSAAAAAAADAAAAKSNVGSPVTVTSTTTSSTKPDTQHDAQPDKAQDAAKAIPDNKPNVIAAVTSPAADNNNHNQVNNGNANQGVTHDNNAATSYSSAPVAATQNTNNHATDVLKDQQTITSFSDSVDQKWPEVLMKRVVEAAREHLRR
ncbi:hypothetical protein GGF32_001633 [Allomyces javanicus]|nr:hypothetical protein GGF32_001633 [Allomyces javanicus]